MHRLTKAQARRIAVRAQLLDAPRPTDLLDVVQRLTLLQIDPTAAIAPSADLVLWSRLGSSYRPDELKRALEEERTLFELDALIRPTSDLGLYLAGAGDRRATSGRVPGCARTTASAATSSSACASPGRWLARDSPTRAPCPGPRPAGRTTQRHADARVPDESRRGGDLRARRAASVSGTSRARLSREVAVPDGGRAERARTSAGSPRSASRGRKARAMPMEPIHVGEAGEPRWSRA